MKPGPSLFLENGMQSAPSLCGARRLLAPLYSCENPACNPYFFLTTPTPTISPLANEDEYTISRWTRKFRIRKGYVTTRNKHMRCEKLFYTFDLGSQRSLAVRATPGGWELRLAGVPARGLRCFGNYALDLNRASQPADYSLTLRPKPQLATDAALPQVSRSCQTLTAFSAP